MRKFFKKIHVLVLSFVLSISNVILINQANASTNMQGWSLSNPVVQGASVLYQGLKNVMINGKNVVKTSTVLIKPTATQVAKLLAKGASGYALSVAVAQLIGEGVDWVLDPANNQIRYKVPKDGSIIYSSGAIPQKFNTAGEYCNARLNLLKTSGGYPKAKLRDIKINSATSGTCWIYTYSTTSAVDFNFDIRTTNETEEKVLPLPTVAQQVINNAENGDSNAKVAVGTVAQDIVNDAENDSAKAKPIVDQLEANATTQTDADAGTATGQTKPNTETGGTDLSLQFPVFCGWAPVVCEAAQVVISFPSQVGAWVTDLLGLGQKVEENTKTTAESTQAIEKELTKDDGIPEKDKTDINLPDLPINPEKVNVNWGGSCPAPTTTSISFHGQSQEITILRYDFICEWAWVIKASVIALASIGAVFIISGRKT